MKDLKFELFITFKQTQLNIRIGEKPVLFGTSDNCEVKMGDGEPGIKAMVQKEGDHLNIKIFDINYPVSISGKKYKSAKIKKSVFFKIGDIDIISNVEEINSDNQVLHELAPEDDHPSLPSYKDSELININELNNQISPEMALYANKVAELEAQLEKLKSEDTSTKTSEKQNTTGLLECYSEDGFNYNIKFKDQINEIICQTYSQQDWDYSSYIDVKDDSVPNIPMPEIHRENDSRSIHIVHMNNGAVLNDEFYPLGAKRIFMSSDRNNKCHMQIHDCGAKKLEFIYKRGEATLISNVTGYHMSRVVDNEIIQELNQSVQLVDDQRVILSKGTSQIVIQFAPTPPKIKTNHLFNIDEDLLKSLALCWSLILVVIASALMTEPHKPLIPRKSQQVVIYKRPPQKPNPIKEQQIKESKPETAQATATVSPQKDPKNNPRKDVKPIQTARENRTTRNQQVSHRNRSNPISQARPTRRNIVKDAKTPVVRAEPTKPKRFRFGDNLLNKKPGSNLPTLKDANSARRDNRVAINQMNSNSNHNNTFRNPNSYGNTNNRIDRFRTDKKNGALGTYLAHDLSNKRDVEVANDRAKTKVLGALDAKVIRKIIRQHIPDFRRCYQRELHNNSKAAGVFDLGFKIMANGKGARTYIKNNGQRFSKNTINCMKGVVKLMKFPRPKGGGYVNVKQPMNFSRI